MHPLLSKGLVLAGVQLAIVLSVAGKYAIDREQLPRVWAKSLPFDPNLPIRGRYVRLRLEVANPPVHEYGKKVHYIKTEDGRLSAVVDDHGTTTLWPRGTSETTVTTEAVAYFIPEHIKDPSIREKGEELWVEVTVPRQGTPRPIRLGVKKDDGPIRPLEIN